MSFNVKQRNGWYRDTKTVMGGGFIKWQGKGSVGKKKKKSAATRLRRVSNAKVRRWGKQGFSLRKGPAGARAESRNSFSLCVPLVAHILPLCVYLRLQKRGSKRV